MNPLFVDTIYFVAVINTRDQWHEKAVALRPFLEGKRLVTTEAVLTETLNYFCEYGANMRRVVALFVRDVLADFNFEVVPNTTKNFLLFRALRNAARQRLQPDRLYFDERLPRARNY